METEEILRRFERIAEAPGGVAQVRKLILDLAVRGKLVPQDPNDEPASALLERIAKERARRIKARELPKEKPLPPIKESEKPFPLPRGWAWARTGQLGRVQLGRQRSPDNHIGPNMRPYLRVANVHEDRIDISDIKEMNFSPEEAERFLLVPDDVLLNEGQSAELVGRPAIYRGEVPGACFQNTLVRFRAFAGLEPRFALLVFRAYMHSGRFRREAQQTTNMAHLSAGRLAEIEFVVAPTDEQMRIVRRVDELTSWANQLEELVARKSRVRQRWLGEFIACQTRPGHTPEDGESLIAHWSKVIRSAGDVSRIRSLILDLAVRGRLVPQDPNDEPASALLERIAKERTRRIKAGELPKEKPPPPIKEAEKPFELPRGWEWARFGDVFAIRSRLVDPEGYAELPHVAPNHIEKGTGKLLGVGTVGGDAVKSVNHRFQAGQILYSKIRPNLAKAALVDFGGLCSADMYPLEPHLDAEYALFSILSSEFTLQVVSGENRVAMPKVNQEALLSVIFPVPPACEQVRVAKVVSNLWRLCDELEGSFMRSVGIETSLSVSLARSLAEST